MRYQTKNRATESGKSHDGIFKLLLAVFYIQMDSKKRFGVYESFKGYFA